MRFGIHRDRQTELGFQFIPGIYLWCFFIRGEFWCAYLYVPSPRQVYYEARHALIGFRGLPDKEGKRQWRAS